MLHIKNIEKYYGSKNNVTKALERISFDVEDGIIRNLEFLGGCNGNAKGISALVEGQRVEDVISKLSGITCGYKTTSCPDQLSKALKALEQA